MGARRGRGRRPIVVRAGRGCGGLRPACGIFTCCREHLENPPGSSGAAPSLPRTQPRLLFHLSAPPSLRGGRADGSVRDDQNKQQTDRWSDKRVEVLQGIITSPFNNLSSQLIMNLDLSGLCLIVIFFLHVVMFWPRSWERLGRDIPVRMSEE